MRVSFLLSIHHRIACGPGIGLDAEKGKQDAHGKEEKIHFIL